MTAAEQVTEQADQSIALGPEQRALVLAALGKAIKAEDRLVRAEFSYDYRPGDSRKFRSPLDGAALGAVLRTDPDPTWTVTDPDALREHLASFPGAVETVYQLDVGDGEVVELPEAAEVTQVLLAHAPHLLAPLVRVSQEVVAAAVAESAESGVAVAPGIGQVPGVPVLRVVPAKDAEAAVQRMVTAGLIRWDGRPTLPAGGAQ